MARRSPDSDSNSVELLRLRGAIEAAGDVVYEWDLATDGLTWSGSTGDLFSGHETLPQTGDALNGFINPEDLPQRLTALSEHFGGHGGYDSEYRIRGADGMFQWVHDRGALVRSPSGDPARMLGVLRLITGGLGEGARLVHDD